MTEVAGQAKGFRLQLLPRIVRCCKIEISFTSRELTLFDMQTVGLSALVAHQLSLIIGSEVTAINAS